MYPQNQIDPKTRAWRNVNALESQIYQGDAFALTAASSSTFVIRVPITQSMFIALRPSTYTPLIKEMVFDSSILAYNVTLWETANITGTTSSSTVIGAVNRNRNATSTPSMEVMVGSSALVIADYGLAAGTMLDTFFVRSTTFGVQRKGFDHEWVLNPTKTYVLQILNVETSGFLVPSVIWTEVA